MLIIFTNYYNFLEFEKKSLTRSWWWEFSYITEVIVAAVPTVLLRGVATLAVVLDDTARVTRLDTTFGDLYPSILVRLNVRPTCLKNRVTIILIC